MEYQEIDNIELKVVLYFLDILQNSRELSEEEKEILDALSLSFPIIEEEKTTIYNYAQNKGWIIAPESFPNNRGGKNFYPINSKKIHEHIRITIIFFYL